MRPGILLLCLASGAFGQWAMPEGFSNKTGPAPKLNGKPDFTGVWQSEAEPLEQSRYLTGEGAARHLIDLAIDLPGGQPPMQPWAAQLQKQRREVNLSKDDPSGACLPVSAPRLWGMTLPYKIVQTPAVMVIMYEQNWSFRQIYFDKRKPVENPQPLHAGYSSTEWDGDKLVVKTSGYPDGGWLDVMGHPHTDQLRVTEKLRRPDYSHLEIELTIDDPKAYTAPWTVTIHARLKETELIEAYCTESNR